MSKTCQNCHDLKSLKKDLTKSYEQFQQLAESSRVREDGLQGQIDQLVAESEIQEQALERQRTEIYRLNCQNESLSNQLSGQPNAAKVKRYKEIMIEAANERTKAWQHAANSARRCATAEMKVKELEKALDQVRNCSYCGCLNPRCDCINDT